MCLAEIKRGRPQTYTELPDKQKVKIHSPKYFFRHRGYFRLKSTPQNPANRNFRSRGHRSPKYPCSAYPTGTAGVHHKLSRSMIKLIGGYTFQKSDLIGNGL